MRTRAEMVSGHARTHVLSRAMNVALGVALIHVVSNFRSLSTIMLTSVEAKTR